MANHHLVRADPDNTLTTEKIMLKSLLLHKNLICQQQNKLYTWAHYTQVIHWDTGDFATKKIWLTCLSTVFVPNGPCQTQ